MVPVDNHSKHLAPLLRCLAAIGVKTDPLLQDSALDKDLLSNGWIDSIQWVRLIQQVQKSFSVQITEQDLLLNPLRSLENWLQLIEQKTSNTQP